MIAKVKSYYVIVDKRGNPLLYTISRTRKLATEKEIYSSRLTWKQYRRKYGHRWVKVDISFKEVPLPPKKIYV